MSLQINNPLSSVLFVGLLSVAMGCGTTTQEDLFREEEDPSINDLEPGDAHFDEPEPDDANADEPEPDEPDPDEPDPDEPDPDQSADLIDEPAPECPTSDVEEPAAILLTWQQDPTTTMTIDWQTEPGDEARSTLCFKGPDADQWWSERDATEFNAPYGDRMIHRVELTGLAPDTEYSFQLGEFSRPYKFRTMPADIDEDPLVFATGGDVQHNSEWMKQTNLVAMQYDLDFIAWGGDLAYGDGTLNDERNGRWEDWFQANMDTLIDEDGRVIPIISAVGNHEVLDGYHSRHDDYEVTDEWREEISPYFFAYFAFPGQPGYGTLDFGDYLSLIFLDTDHNNPVDGAQTEWLDGELSDRSDVENVFPIYHFPAYPSHRSMTEVVSERIREHWVPLFEQYGVEMAFENHDHTYKRTHPIRADEVNEDGVRYIGDGAWGVRTREGNNRNDWYIDEFREARHAIIVTLTADERHILAVDQDGEVIDEFGD